jgi:hypothetical protein
VIPRAIPEYIPRHIPENAMTRTAHNPNPNRIPSPSLMLLCTLLAVALAAAPRLQAAETAHAAANPGLDVDCDQRFISQQQASWLLGTDNFSQTYDRRAALRAEVARACADGVAAVRIEGKRADVSVARL